MQNDITIINKALDELIPYANNPRKNDAAVKYVAASMDEFGCKVPLVIDKNGVIVAGHTRYKAARSLGWTHVPCIVADDLSDEQVKAFRLADNKVSEVAEWDDDALDIELEDIVGIDMEQFGFVFEDENGEDEENPYTTKIKAPQYEITGDCPTIDECVDVEKMEQLQKEIEAADISEDDKRFLMLAAQRHLLFNYKNIAEYYAHADETVQRLMEKSALVIIDYDDAIANGYTELSDFINALRGEEYGE